MTGGLSGTTADFSGKVEFQGTAAIEGGTSGSGYGLFKGYSANYNHFLLSRGSVTGSTSSPTFGGTHQMTFVEYVANAADGFRFKSSNTGTYAEIAYINRVGINTIGAYHVNGTAVIDASRNLTNIGTYAGLGTMTLGNYTGAEQLQFLANQNGTSHIYWRDNNQSEGTYLKAKGESGGGDITFGARWDDDEDKIFFKLRQSSATYTPDAAIGIGISPTEILHLYEDNSTMGNTTLKVHNNKTDDAAVLWLEGKRTSNNDTAQIIGANNGNIVTNIRTFSSGDNGTLKFYTSTSGTGSSVVERFGITDGGNITVGGTIVIDASRAITNCTGISLTGGSISSYGSVTAGLGSFLVGSRGKMGQVSNDLFVCSTTASHSGLRFANGAIHPTDNTGAQSDSAMIDLGATSYRFSDIYARNGTIQTSDRNEKENIEELSDAEQRVAVRAKGLLRKFKWKDAVAEKGDNARIHFGIVAQDLQSAFVAEGLDAGHYGMFISSTWTNEDGEEQTRMGVRYAELLAFIISAI
tara:strand:- start:112 stop:1683 length:1572 start_codon:yes stop_codon:yes gene_type:complete